MEIDNKFGKIINIEASIYNFISYLYEFELYDNKNSEVFDNFFNLYKLAVEDEKKIFSSLSDIELKKIIDYIYDNKNNIFDKCNDSIKNNFNYIIGRVKNKISEYLIKPNTFDNTNLYILNERKDIYLSFLDEYINNIYDFEIKKGLMKEKYELIFNTNSIHENEIIKRKFGTNESIYLTSEFVSIFEGCDYDLYNILKMNAGITYIDEINSDMIKIKNSDKNSIDKCDLIIAFLKIRTGMLMLENESFNHVMSQFKNRINDFEILDSVFDEDFEEALNGDRRRHKTLSFRKK